MDTSPVISSTNLVAPQGVSTLARPSPRLSDWRGSVTTFNGFTGTSPVLEKVNSSWGEVSALLCPPSPSVREDKTQAQYIVPCKLKVAPLVGNTLDAATRNGQPTSDKMRSKTHVTEASMLVMDVDGLPDADFKSGLAKMEADGLTFLAYTTHSHGREDKPGIRARLAVPIDRSLSVENYTAAWHGLDQHYWGGQAGRADASGANMYQQQGTWCCHPDRIDQAESWHVEGGVASADTLVAIGRAVLPPVSVRAIKPPIARSSQNDGTKAGSSTNDYPPSDANKVADACRQIGAFRETKGANQIEPVWFNCLGITAYCTDGEKVSQEWSSGHADYNGRNTARKLDYRLRIPPTTCDQFRKTNASGCLGCTQTCNSPITLGWAAVGSGFDEPFARCETIVVTQGAGALDSTAGAASSGSDQAITQLNEKFAWIEEYATIYRLDFGNFIDPHKFKLQHDNRKIQGASRSVGLGSAWLKSEHRRQHKSLVIRPAEGVVTADNCLNEWTGFCTPPTRGDVRPFLRLLVRLMPERIPRRYVQRWMAHLIKFPNIKMFVSLAMWSHAEGVGKNLLFETLVAIIGPVHASVIGQTELTSAFNGWANRRILVIGDEVSGDDKRAQNDKLKGLITGTAVHINEKYQPDREAPNLLNFIFLSNHHDALFLNDHDRRFFVWEVEAGRLPESHVAKFVQWRDSGGLAALHYFLLNSPLGDFKPRAPAPMTNAKQQMADDNRSDLEAWVSDLMASDIVKEFGRELATANEIGKKYAFDTDHLAPSSKAIVGACKRQGAYARTNQVRLDSGKKIRPLALVRIDFWKTQSESDWAAEMAKRASFDL